MKYYSIHDIIGIKTNMDLPIPDYFKTKKKLSDPDIEVLLKNLRFSRPKGNEMLRCDYYFWKKKTTLFFDYDLLNGRLQMSDILGGARIVCTRNFKRFCSDIGWKNLLETIILIKLIQKGSTFIQSGCLSYLGKYAVLISGLPDLGKTSTVLSLLDGKKFRFMSDDLTIIKKDGSAYSYPREANVSAHTSTGYLPHPQGYLKRKLFKSRAISLFTEKILRRATTRRMKIPDELINDKSPIEKIFLLGGYEKSGTIKRISKKEAIKAIMTSTIASESPIHGSLDLYCYSFGIDLFDVLKKRREILENAIKNTECYRLAAPSVEKYPQMIREVLEE